MAHQNTWHGVTGASTFFAVTGAAMGNQFQENAGAIISVIALVIVSLMQLRQKIGEGRVKALEIELQEAELKAKIEKAKHEARDVIDQAAVQASELVKTAADDASAKLAS